MDQETLKALGDATPWEEVQGLLNYGYRHLPAGRYLLLRVVEPGAARAWLAGLAGRLTNARTNPRDRALNAALTADGLRALGAADDALASFSGAFADGMVMPHRSRILGDFGPNEPARWRWGAAPDTTPHVLLMAFGPDPEGARAFADELLGEAAGLRLLEGLDIEASLPIDRDHFGFVDGIAQPRVAGAPAADGGSHDGDTAVGEFLLGRPNQRMQQDPVPSLGLPSEEAGGARFGQDGTYLVFRQMDQDPGAFRDFCVAQDPESPDRVSSRLVGRWPDGTPLMVSPDEPGTAPGLPNAPGVRAARPDHPRAKSMDVDFGYGDDPDGVRCPLGAHVRRANPRDGLRNGEDPPSADARDASLTIASHHRILRRGRIYGPTWRPGGEGPCPPATRGLHFLCLNASIENQFEFVQQTWLSSPKFLGLYDEVDPLVGIGQGPEGLCSYTIPQPDGAFRRRLGGIPRFITVRGGAYFFLPSLPAFSMLGALGQKGPA